VEVAQAAWPDYGREGDNDGMKTVRETGTGQQVAHPMTDI